MAKIPLLECLTRNSYRESIDKSSSSPGKDSDETEEDDKSTDSVLCPSESQRSSNPPACVSAPGTTPPGPSDGQETNEMTDSSGLRAALQEEDAPEKANPPSFNVTLLDWINVQDRPNDVESVVRKCFDSINRVSVRHWPLSLLVSMNSGFDVGVCVKVLKEKRPLLLYHFFCCLSA